MSGRDRARTSSRTGGRFAIPLQPFHSRLVRRTDSRTPPDRSPGSARHLIGRLGILATVANTVHGDPLPRRRMKTSTTVSPVVIIFMASESNRSNLKSPPLPIGHPVSTVSKSRADKGAPSTSSTSSRAGPHDPPSLRQHQRCFILAVAERIDRHQCEVRWVVVHRLEPHPTEACVFRQIHANHTNSSIRRLSTVPRTRALAVSVGVDMHGICASPHARAKTSNSGLCVTTLPPCGRRIGAVAHPQTASALNQQQRATTARACNSMVRP